MSKRLPLDTNLIVRHLVQRLWVMARHNHCLRAETQPK